MADILVPLCAACGYTLTYTDMVCVSPVCGIRWGIDRRGRLRRVESTPPL